MQSSSTKKVTVNDLTAGKAVSVKTLSTLTTSLADNTTFESTTNTGIYVRWKRPNKSYIVSLDINNNGGKNFSVFDETAGATRLDISDGGDVTVNTGNLIQGTAAKGINFTANTPAAGMTSQLLNWYEEGTFTPSWAGSTGNPTVTYATRTGKYTRIGNVVYFNIVMYVSAATGGSGDLSITGLPFNSSAAGTSYVNFLYNFAAGAPTTSAIGVGGNSLVCYSAEHGTDITHSLVSSLTGGSFDKYFIAGGFYFV